MLEFFFDVIPYFMELAIDFIALSTLFSWFLSDFFYSVVIKCYSECSNSDIIIYVHWTYFDNAINISYDSSRSACFFHVCDKLQNINI